MKVLIPVDGSPCSSTPIGTTVTACGVPLLKPGVVTLTLAVPAVPRGSA